MTPYGQAGNGYRDASAVVQSASQIEYQAFARITHALRQHAAADHTTFPRLVEALHENLRLWTIVATDVAMPENSLPQPLRAQFFYLAEFTRAHTRKILKGDAEVSALVDINLAVMKGLRAQSGAETCPA